MFRHLWADCLRQCAILNISQPYRPIGLLRDSFTFIHSCVATDHCRCISRPMQQQGYWHEKLPQCSNHFCQPKPMASMFLLHIHWQNCIGQEPTYNSIQHSAWNPTMWPRSILVQHDHRMIQGQATPVTHSETQHLLYACVNFLRWIGLRNTKRSIKTSHYSRRERYGSKKKVKLSP
jgi:hypothetical protein